MKLRVAMKTNCVTMGAVGKEDARGRVSMAREEGRTPPPPLAVQSHS